MFALPQYRSALAAPLALVRSSTSLGQIKTDFFSVNAAKSQLDEQLELVNMDPNLSRLICRFVFRL